jgi:hypothetical protein
MSAPSSSRPVYVPKKSRRGRGGRGDRGGGRFHGAFTGGFSAGYFNTVGSAEGWQPQQQQQQQQQTGVSLSLEENLNNHLEEEEVDHTPRVQRPEDFMDEQDHDEWGGPVAVQRDYRDGSVSTTAIPTGTNKNKPESQSVQLTDLLWSVDSAPENVGRRLLRLLGWREGQSTAYVPAETTSRDQTLQTNLGEDAPLEENKVLSQKRLRKITLQQKRVHIPSPKLDTCGLGYEPYLNAPEFRKHQEKRRKLAQERAQPGQSVYRVSNVLGGNDDDDDNDNGDGPTVVHPTSGDREDAGDPYVSYETVEDFVGSKSVGGFALRGDEDDAYDDQLLTKMSGGKVKIDKEAFDTVAYEHESDDEAVDTKHENDAIDFGGVLSSWANSSNPATATDKNPTSQGGVTTDGRPPLTGFALGGASLPNQNQRFRGPDLPENYQVKRHVFGPDEHPLVLKAVSRAVQLEVADERKQEVLQEALDANARSNRPPTASRVQPVGPMAGTTFVGLAEAMKNRFTASSSSTETKTGDQTLVPGISHAKPGGSHGETTPPNTTTDTTVKTKPEIKISRTIVPFAPEALLCKRLGVVRPKNVKAASAGIGDRNTEESYFQEQILKKAGGAVSSSTVTTERRKSSKDDVLASLNEAEVPPDAEAERPTMAIYKSIFEPESESSESESEGASDKEQEEKAEVIADELAQSEESAKASPAPGQLEESQIVAYSEPKRSDEQVDDETRERSRRRRRRRSRSAEDSSDDSSDGDERRKRRKKDSRKERRHRDEKKHKKKKKKSSKRKHEYK